MTKLITALNVTAWSGFWVFGYLALLAEPERASATVAVVLALLGGGAGLGVSACLARRARPRDAGHAKHGIGVTA